MATNTREDNLEKIIVDYLVENNGYQLGNIRDYKVDYAVDEKKLMEFIKNTQLDEYEKLNLDNENYREKFLNRLRGEVGKRGIIDVLRNGMKIYPANLVMFYMTPNANNSTSKELFAGNIFSVTRQLQYSRANLRLAIDFVIFINGLPIITFELKNNLSKQNYEDAIEQYKNDRSPKDLLLNFKRCIMHVALDENEVYYCTELKGKDSWFIPFNKGVNNGAGNPLNLTGLKTDYFWKIFLNKIKLSKIIENYTQVVKKTDPSTKKVRQTQIFPRYHQIDVVEKLMNDVVVNGVGRRYLIQHSAGSGKSNSIAWLAHQLVDLERQNKVCFDSVIVVTDRVNLDTQIKNTIKQFMQVRSTVGHADSSGDLKKLITDGKKIIITTVHKFPYILDDIGTSHKNNTFAIIIDEAHSSQSGSMSAKMNMVLSKNSNEEDLSVEDIINNIIENRKMLTNASYFAFTATPKNKTLEMFGIKKTIQGDIRFEPFHLYSMKQAIEEGFILDVLRHYTPIKSYYRIAKVIEDDPLFDKKKSQKKLRNYVESNDFAIDHKANIIVEHFHNNVISKGKINGKARSMVVCSGIERAIDYYFSINKYLRERKSPYKCIIAFSGEKKYNGKTLTETVINGFASKYIEDNFKQDPYRFLVVADKFQTGFDEPLLHTMYVDKILTDIKAVQTLSRLNRAAPGKNDTFVLDFANDPNDIQKAFQKYYQTTILADETDPNKLYDLFDTITNYEIIDSTTVDNFIELFLTGSSRELLDPILDVCVSNYASLEEDDQVIFKSSCKQFVRLYNFLASLLPYGSVEWEKYSTFIHFLIRKLPSPAEEDLSKGILDSIDLDSYRAEVKSTISILLEDNQESEISPIPIGDASGKKDPELELLSAILQTFHDLWGNIDWKDEDQIKMHISNIPVIVSKDPAYQNAMRNSDKQNARIESERALKNAITDMMSDNLELFKQFNDNPSFNKWLADMVFELTYNKEGTEFKDNVKI